MSTAPQIKFSYFKLTARGELSRLLFTFGGVAFEDHIVSNFAEFKPTCPLGQLPVLEVDGKHFCQSNAISRYAAKLGGLYPHDPVDALHADMVSETLIELFNVYISIRFHEKDEAVKAKKFKTFESETAPKFFGVLETMVKGKFFNGDSASYADVHLFDVVHNAVNVSLPEFSMGAYPKLQGIVAEVKANANVAAYLAKTHQSTCSDRRMDPSSAAHSSTVASFLILDLSAENPSAKTHSPEDSSFTMAPQLKLTYFNGTGRAELIRLALHFGGVAFEDERITHADLAALKPSLPLGQLPVLQVDGERFAQSMAIARYAAKLSGLLPSDAEQALRVDMISETLSELRGVCSTIMYREKDEAVKAEKTKTLLEETVPKTLGVLEKMVQGAFFLNDSSASYADLQLFDILVNGLQTNFPAFDASPYPKLQRVVESVKTNEKIAAYLETQKK